MHTGPVKTFRDPVYGDIELPQGLLCELIDQPDFQRLRRIRQLGVCYTTFHGAEHSRFQHTLGACWLAYQVLRNWSWRQEMEISPLEWKATLAAVALHDIGHGPFSHALEHVFSGIDHEAIGVSLIRERFRPLLEKHGLECENVIDILTGRTPRVIFHELISGQLDVDRLDYVQRDSLFTGTRYGVLDAQRILSQMVPVFDLERNSEVLAIHGKAVEAVEAFFFSRYFMHWQVYFHRTVRAAEFLLRSILARARSLARDRPGRVQIPAGLQFLFEADLDSACSGEALEAFVSLDDSDILHAIKLWQSSQDPVLSDLSQRFLARRLPKVLRGGGEEARQRVEAIVRARFPEHLELYFEIDLPSDLALENEKAPIRVLTGRGREWKPLSQVTRTAALRALGERVSQSLILYPPECREQVEEALRPLG